MEIGDAVCHQGANSPTSLILVNPYRLTEEQLYSRSGRRQLVVGMDFWENSDSLAISTLGSVL